MTDEADDQGGAIAPRLRSVDRLLEDAQVIEAESAKEADALGFMARGVGPRPPCCIAPRQETSLPGPTGISLSVSRRSWSPLRELFPVVAQPG